MLWVTLKYYFWLYLGIFTSIVWFCSTTCCVKRGYLTSRYSNKVWEWLWNTIILWIVLYYYLKVWPPAWVLLWYVEKVIKITVKWLLSLWWKCWINLLGRYVLLEIDLDHNEYKNNKWETIFEMMVSADIEKLEICIAFINRTHLRVEITQINIPYRVWSTFATKSLFFYWYLETNNIKNIEPLSMLNAPSL